jgi:uncharacterized protein (UPF0303 family)
MTHMSYQVPDLEHFDHHDAWRVGCALVEQCRDEGLTATISIKIADQRVFHAALPGTSADNDNWVDRKSRSARHFDLPTIDVQERYLGNGSEAFFTAFGLSATDHAPFAGAVPIRVRGTSVGTLAMSGIADGGPKEHQLAVGALRREADRQLGQA